MCIVNSEVHNLNFKKLLLIFTYLCMSYIADVLCLFTGNVCFEMFSLIVV